MNERLEWFFTGLLSLVLLFISALFIGTGRMMYGPDAILIAVMGGIFMKSVETITLSIINLYKHYAFRDKGVKDVQ